jgi:hypothetical protein
MGARRHSVQKIIFVPGTKILYPVQLFVPGTNFCTECLLPPDYAAKLNLDKNKNYQKVSRTFLFLIKFYVLKVVEVEKKTKTTNNKQKLF